jgi:hypothetical protein
MFDRSHRKNPFVDSFDSTHIARDSKKNRVFCPQPGGETEIERRNVEMKAKTAKPAAKKAAAKAPAKKAPAKKKK